MPRDPGPGVPLKPSDLWLPWGVLAILLAAIALGAWLTSNLPDPGCP